MHSKLLVDATDLAQWAERRDSQSMLPQLIRSLILSSSVHINRINFAAGEGVSLGGWDGITIAEEGDSFVPTGTSVWEMGVNRNVKGKADNDYEKRCNNPLFMIPAETTYVFITLRRWKDKDKWTEEKQKEGVWKEVCVYDADDLETWLSLNPTVHVWLSILLGKHPQNCIDLSGYWIDWSEETQPAITPEMVLAGRENITSEIYKWLESSHSPLTLQAETRDEAIAVFAASISLLPSKEKDFFLSKAIVVKSLDAWSYLSSSQNNLILIPTFDSESLSRAIRNGHHILIVLGRSDCSTSDTLQIPRLSRDKVTEILIGKGIDDDQSRELGLMARRGLTTYRRRMAISPEVRQPLWARPSEARSLVPILLVGAWHEDREGDKKALADLAGVSYEYVNEVLIRWAYESDPPIRKVGHIWYLISKEDAWTQLVRYITSNDMDKFKSLVLNVLGEVNPKYTLPIERQWYAGLLGRSSIYSDLLKRNIADTLAFMGSKAASFHPSLSLRNISSTIIYELFEVAKGDWQLWSTLSPVLPLLAEAAPDRFFDALEFQLKDSDTAVNLFNDQKDSMFGSSPHTHILWALEILAWNPEYLGRVTMLLARLSNIDPGGKLSNRPDNSLREIFLTWHAQTCATVEQRLQTLELLVRKEPDVAWKLLCKLLPQYNSIGHNNSKPKWNEWALNYKGSISAAEYGKATHEIIKMLLSLVGESVQRWKEIIQSLSNQSLEDFQLVLEQLKLLSQSNLDSKRKTELWNALRREVLRHRSFPDSDWALSNELVDKLEAVFFNFKPTDIILLYSWLFDQRPAFPRERGMHWEEHKKLLKQERKDAVTAIYQKLGLAGIENLLDNVENSYQLGVTVGEIGILGAEEDHMMEMNLDSTEQKYSEYARGYLLGRIVYEGYDWIRNKLSSVAKVWSVNKKNELFLHLPAEESTWMLLEKESIEIRSKYWSSISPYTIHQENLDKAVGYYLQYKFPYSAIEILGLNKDYSKPLQIIESLEQALSVSYKDNISRDSFSYYLSEIFQVLEESNEVDEERIASMEWAYLPILKDQFYTPKFLHHKLSRDPSFFADVITLIYDSENEQPDELKETTEESQWHINRALDLLESWTVLPGQDDSNNIDEEFIYTWVKEALRIVSDRGRSKYGARHIGEILSKSVNGNDGAYPHEYVRNIIEDMANLNLEKGFKTSVYNSRGVYMKQILEGGEQERHLSEKYNNYANITSLRWPRTTTILRSIASYYGGEARSEDISAELSEDLYD
ncbi:hypothetical protein ACYCS5_04190 [Paenibacillus sp. SEL3]